MVITIIINNVSFTAAVAIYPGYMYAWYKKGKCESKLK